MDKKDINEQNRRMGRPVLGPNDDQLLYERQKDQVDAQRADFEQRRETREGFRKSKANSIIFQQEMNNGIKEWNTIQEIKSPTASPLSHPDRFGHAVAISDDAQIIIIGSPYMSDPIQVYAYDKEVNPVTSVGTWLTRVGPLDEPLPGKPNGYIYEKYLRYMLCCSSYEYSSYSRSTFYPWS